MTELKEVYNKICFGAYNAKDKTKCSACDLVSDCTRYTKNRALINRIIKKYDEYAWNGIVNGEKEKTNNFLTLSYCLSLVAIGLLIFVMVEAW